MTRADLVALLAALLSVLLGWRSLQWGLDKADPRRRTLRALRSVRIRVTTCS